MDLVGEKTLEIMASADTYNRWLFSLIKPHLASPVAEIGAGTGIFTSLLKDSHFTLTAFDNSSRYVTLLKKKFPRVKSIYLDISTHQLPGNLSISFNSAIMLNVLEHIPDSAQALKNVYRFLKLHGKLIILVPAHDWAYGPLDESLGHVQRYTKSSLAHDLTSAGFKVLSARYLNPLGLLGWWFNGRVLRRTLLPSRQVRLFDQLLSCLLTLEKHFPPRFGLSVLCIAEKSQ